MNPSLLLNLEDFVRVTNHSEEDVEGRYDGKNYTFKAHDYMDVHKVVAEHVFGYGLPTQSEDPRLYTKVNAFLRLGWIGGPKDLTMKQALARASQFMFEPVPPFPNVRVLHRHEDQYRPPEIEVIPDAEESSPRGPPGTMVGGGTRGEAETPSVPVGPEDPQAHLPSRVQLTLPKKTGKA